MIRRLENSYKKIAFVSSFAPRRCGIATFASDLIESVGRSGQDDFKPVVIAMDSGTRESYHNPVKLNIRKEIENDYITAADYVNQSDIEMVSLQHEYGLFGGNAGAMIQLFLNRVYKPVVTTMHTVLESPDEDYFNATVEVAKASDKLVVMNERGLKMLREIYKVPSDKIQLIPHGIPDLPFVHSTYYKRRLGLTGKKIILTFGFLSRNKGIETMLEALPRIIQTNPSVLYIVLGATHPEVLRCEGQAYKHELEEKVRKLELEGHVVFYDQFVEEALLHQFLGAADIYVTPYLHREQLTSGTLAFAVGVGKAVVSTPYWAAQELLADGRGKLVRFGDSRHVADTIGELFADEILLNKLKKRAYDYGRARTWPNIGKIYWKLFKECVSSEIMDRGSNGFEKDLVSKREITVRIA